MRQYINKHWYYTKDDEFVIKPHSEFNNLKIYPKVGELERVSGLLCDLTELYQDANLLCVGWSHGGLVPITCARRLTTVYVQGKSEDLDLPKNIVFSSDICPQVIFLEKEQILPMSTEKPILVTEQTGISGYEHCISLERSPYKIYMTGTQYELFMKEFHYYFKDSKFEYDNLIQLCIMVKNGGETFKEVLEKNLPNIDRWVILDTGSTDGTIDIINQVLVGKKKGTLYQEPFLNFRDSRNRLLDLAGELCTYTLMLDDTYYVEKNLRGFLETIRGDQYGRSYSLIIKSNDSEYYSNRVLKACWKLRYIYKLHEVIQDYDNVNVVIPPAEATIFDVRSDFMEERTQARKEYDLRILLDMLEEEPQVSRHLYYVAQTYSCMKNYKKAAEYFLLRATSHVEGFKQEVYDSYFECARIYNFQLGKPWTECEKLYLKAHSVDPSRNDALYFLGIHYFLEGGESRKIAYDYFCKAFDLGYPLHCQFSLKPTLYFYYLPKFLAQLCYEFHDIERGLKCTEVFLSKAKSDDPETNTMLSWKAIFELQKQFVLLNHLTKAIQPGTKPIVGILDLYHTPKLQNLMKKLAVNYDVSLFTQKQAFLRFLQQNSVHRVYILQENSYIPVCLMSGVQEIYLIVTKDLPTGNIIPIVPQIKQIVCMNELSECLSVFPQFKDRCAQIDSFEKFDA